MKIAATAIRRNEVELCLHLHGLWEGLIALPPPPRPPFDIENRQGIGGVLDAGEAGAHRAGRANQTLEPLDVPGQWGWSDAMDLPPTEWWAGDEPAWQAPGLDLGDGTVLVLDAGDPFPPDE